MDVYYCVTCRLYLQAGQVERGQHRLIVQNGPDVFHVVQRVLNP